MIKIEKMTNPQDSIHDSSKIFLFCHDFTDNNISNISDIRGFQI